MKNYIDAADHKIVFNDDGYSFISKLLIENRYSKIFILVDCNSHEYCLQYFLENLATEILIEIIEIEDGEENKNIQTCVEIWKALTELGADRKSVLISLGGGVVTDIGGFVASTYKRGIDFIHVPTTLLAMVDASIGGKNGVDLDHLKNQIGIIRNPKTILIDSFFLKTLPENQLKSGMAEMLKHGLIFDETYWDKFYDLKNLDFQTLDTLIYESIVIKNTIVTQDPTENGIRKALNFGHTLGHAIESYFLESETKTKLLHGEAIAVGMILESFLSREHNLISDQQYQNVKTKLKNIFPFVQIYSQDHQPILELLIHDKKNEYGSIQFVLLDQVGNTKQNQIVNNDLIIRAFDDYKI
ncbi:MAG: hypothetical protein RLZZ312_1583 [Bacteroidota bacterium]